MDIKDATHPQLLQELMDRTQESSIRYFRKNHQKFWRCVRFMLSLDKRDAREEAKVVDEEFAMKINALVPNEVDLRQVKCVLWALSQLKDKAIGEISRIASL